jgi:hypothetical membrane protein
VTLNRWLAMGGIAASLLFLPVVYLVGETRPGYSQVANHISALSASGPGAWAQTTNLVVFGLLIAGLGWGLYRALGGPTLGPLLVVVTGVFAGIGTAVFPEVRGGDPMTVVGVLHSVSSVVAFVALAGAMLVLLPRRFAADATWSSLIVPSRCLGGVAAAMFFLFPLGVWGMVGSLETRTGLIQRIFAVAVLLWFFLLSLRLLQTSDPVSSEPGVTAATRPGTALGSIARRRSSPG